MNFFSPTYIIAVLIALTVHEWAHAKTANLLGDPTAEQEGRLTLNPISHLDPIGALLFLFVGFGWAKPVPVNPLYFKKPNRDMALTAFAGPFSNLILATIAFFFLSLMTDVSVATIFGLLGTPSGSSAAAAIGFQILRDSIFVNLALMAFNLFPVAPLDGSNILRMFIPRVYAEKYEDFVRIGPWILLFLILFESFLPIQLLSGWVFTIMQAVFTVFMAALSTSIHR